MKNFALVLAALPLALACDSTKVSCGMLIHDEVNGACVCPPGVEVDYDRWLCLFPDAAVPIDPFDAGLDAAVEPDAGHDAGTDGGSDGGFDGGSDAGPGCMPTDEVCEGSLDEDCDDEVDEGCACTNEDTRACGPDQGVCEAGTQVCVSGAWGDCEGEDVPGTEVCEGSLDEDCDGSVDEGCSCANGTVRPCPGGIDTGECAAGTQTCASGAWGSCVGAVGPTAEVCDGRDNDCDTVIDGPAASAACGTANNATALACSAGECIITSCLLGTEDCNDDLSDGCEVDLTVDRNHCGVCARRCSDNQVCGSSSCVSAPLAVLSRGSLSTTTTFFSDSTGDRYRDRATIDALPDGRAFVLEYGSDVAGGYDNLWALNDDLSNDWSSSSSGYSSLACTETTCATVGLEFPRSGIVEVHRFPLVSSSPVGVRVGEFPWPPTPPPVTTTVTNRFLHIGRTATAFAAPDVSLDAPTDGRVAFAGRTDIVYTTSSPRHLRATRLSGAPMWTFSLPAGWTIEDGAAGIAGFSGSETYTYTIATRVVSGRVVSRVSQVNEGSESEWAEIADPARDVVAESIAVAPNGDIFVVGSRGNRAFVAVYQEDMTFQYLREATGTAYSRFMDVVFLPTGEALVIGIRTEGSLSFGTASLGSGTAPSAGDLDTAESFFFAQRLRVR